MVAVRAYIREIREQRGISQEELGNAVGLSLRQISRLESGESESIKADVLLKAISFLGASIDHVNRLFADPDASDEDAKRAAKEWLTAEQQQSMKHIVEHTDHDRLALIAQQIREMSPDELIDLISEASGALRGQEVDIRPRRRQPWRLWRRGSSPETER